MQKKGFTLLEVLLVIALIGILLTIILVVLNPRERFAVARNDVRKSDIQKLEGALTQYRLQEGSYPAGLTSTLQEICDPDISNPSVNCGSYINLSSLVPTYIQSIPQDPQDTDSTGGSGYQVAVDVTRNVVALKAIQAESSATISINDPLSSALPSTVINAPLAASNPQYPCPEGYIPVPNNPLYNTGDFCVMKYEPKAVAIAAPTVGLTTPNTGSNTIANNTTATTSANSRAVASVASGFPIANIDQPTAATYCINAGGSLITNKEWMTIARNIEAQPSNWTGGTVGSGGLWRGHSDGAPNLALAAGADNDPYNGTGNTAPSIERRTHTLSNGQVIWDLSGNNMEWTNDTIIGANQPTITATPGFTYREFPTLTSNGILSYDDYRPSNNTWNTTQNMGRIWSDGTPGNNTIYGFFRGGDWGPALSGGIFTLTLGATPSNIDGRVGFRCVTRAGQTPPLGFTGFNAAIGGIVQQSDGKLVLVGDFTQYQGVATNRIIRLNSDGTRDSSFNIGAGFDNSTTRIIQQSDGKLVIVGTFTQYQGVVANRIIRLNSDGSRDNSFGIGTGLDNTVYNVIQQSDGQIVAVGDFLTYQGVAANRIIRLNTDGTRDATFTIGSGFSSFVSTIIQQSDGKLVIGGGFGSYQGVAANNIIRLNSDGSRDGSFNMGTGFGANSVRNIVQQSDGKLVAVGVFPSYQGVAANNIIRLNSDGSRDSSFNMGTGFNNEVYRVLQQSDGKIVVGGSFSTYQGVAANNIIRLNSDGSRDNSFGIGTGLDNAVYNVIQQSDGQIVAVGDFLTYQGVAANRIIRLNTDGGRAQ